MSYRVATATPADEPLLWAMLFEAAHAAEQHMTSPDQLRSVPELARYVEGWGRPGDLGVVGGPDGGAGAAWLRLFPADNPGYGYVDDATPELAIGVAPQLRGSGLGTTLLRRLLTDARQRYEAVSLSVRQTNPALRLYERLGFAVVPGSPIVNRAGTTSVTMVRRFR
ncbi:ribosomal protein S18 acetylase RimI-like enzyme [Nocardia kruczakiae]|uniref:Ribosomal protein S18 acetylase RimI-like enzyme n=1 Tax=Nocardia kruczakiae TaxID=261477 RepID=A0ABU1XFW0_9NOCA|nr:GNAT family N-acetyltransferase [Nocardia kruczakiae]MDR7168857.1 ribosomal protein S18 acetylase RimI-like enzyme [Nocardia kruczakiae]